MKKVTFPKSFAMCAVLVMLCVLPGSAKTYGRASGEEASPTANAVDDADTLNIRDFGALGNGSTDDGPALQRALDALATAGGGTLFVPAGRYAINTPVRKDFTGVASSISITGVPSSAQVAPITSSGDEMTRGLALTSEFYPRTGTQGVAISLMGLDSLLFKDVAFVGTPDVLTDALITLDLRDIDSITIRHCEFYGLSSLTPGGSIIQAIRSSLRVEQTLFLGCTAASAHHTSVVHNIEWKGISFEQVIFADYGQRPIFFGKCYLSAPMSWINIGNAAPPTSDSPRREVMVRNVVLDEGGYWGITGLPYFYLPASAPIDLVYVSALRMNVSNLGRIGHLLYNTRSVMVERSTYEWNNSTASASTLYNIGHAIFSQITCLAGVRTINADPATQKLTVINSGCTNIDSHAQATTVINGATTDTNPVEYVRAQYAAVASRTPEPAGHYYWSDLLIRCGDNAQCRTAQRAALAAYLASAPAPTFTLAGQVKDENGVALVGATVALTGSQTVTTTTDAGGRYSFSNLPTSGQYAVTATATHYTFESKNVVTPAGNVTTDIPGKINRHTISGRIAKADNSGIAGVSVKLSNAQTELTATTNATGNYSFTNLPAGRDYVVTPSHIHYTFAPSSRSLNNLSGNQTADFNGTLKTHTIGGRVAVAGTALPGVTVMLGSSQTASTNTDAAGNYSFPNVPAGGNYTVTPSRAHYTFNAASLAFNNLSAPQTGNFNATPNTYNLSGRVTDGANNALSGVTITVSGAQSKVATTDANGNYSIIGLNGGGDYTVTPSRTNYTFAPASLSFNNLSANQTGNFTATLNNYTLGGRIGDGANSGLGGVNVTLDGGKSATTTTDANGNYSFTNLLAGANYTVTPQLADYTFAPASASFQNLSANGTANFTASLNSHAISGRVTVGGGNGLANVTLNLTGGRTASVVSDVNGNYTFQNLPAGNTYTVTPSLANYAFAPQSRTFDGLSANQKADFDGTLNLHKISGRITESANSFAGVTVSLSGGQTATTTTDASGNYSFTNLPAGANYTVTPARQNYTFTPQSLSFTNLGGDLTGANFSGVLNRYSIGGRVFDATGAAFAGVSVELGGDQTATATTDAGGNYSFPNLPAGGNYTVAASQNFTFTPPLKAFAALSGDQPNADFTAEAVPKTVQFGQANYQVSEGSVRVTLVVTRTGDTSGAATVEYAFAESAEGVPCIAADGTANGRCDYHSSASALTFAPGEDTKEISIQLIDDAHVEGAETLRLTLVGATGASLGEQSTTTLVIQDNDTAAGQNPIFTTSFFVRMQYLDFLSREPEAGEPWSAVLNGCSDVNNNPACDRVLVSQSFFGSPEFRLTGFYAFNFYSVAFKRRPNYDEIISDMASITGATVEETYRKRAAIAVSFTDSAEFKELYDGLSDAPFVNALLEPYELQQITTPDPANPEGGAKVTLTRAELVRRLGIVGAESLTRAQVLRAVVESDEVAAAEFNRAFVAMQYYGYLRRTPEAEGYEAWLRVINQDPGNVRVMVDGFMNSTEYQLRFGPPKAAGGGN